MNPRPLFIRLALLAFVLSSPVAMAQEQAKSVKFTEPVTEATENMDTKQLLAACDNRVEVCERDAVGVPFLAAAYMAIWGILFAFLIVIRRGQRRLELELQELERRLDGPGGAAV